MNFNADDRDGSHRMADLEASVKKYEEILLADRTPTTCQRHIRSFGSWLEPRYIERQHGLRSGGEWRTGNYREGVW